MSKSNKSNKPITAEADEDGFGPVYYVIEDEEGNEYEIEVLDALELDGTLYYAVTDAGNPDKYKVRIFKVVEENGEELFAAILDVDELKRVYSEFDAIWFDDEDDED